MSEEGLTGFLFQPKKINLFQGCNAATSPHLQKNSSTYN